MPAITGIPSGYAHLDTDTSGKQRFKLPNGQVFVVHADGSIETEPSTHREVTLHERGYHPVTGEVVNGAKVGSVKVKYGPPPNYTIPGALVHQGRAFEKISDDTFRATETSESEEAVSN